MIHVVFQQNDIDTLKKAIALDESIQGDVIQIKDDFAAGPLKNIYSPEGIESRKKWWRDILAGGDYDGIVDDGSVADDNITVAELTWILKADTGETMWIWAGQNQHDISGYFWLVSQLKAFQGR